MRRDTSQYILIFICSFGCLAYEIILTRIFSITLWYHFAFMIVSIAMLGIAAAGALMYLLPMFRNAENTGIYSVCLGAGILFSYLLTNWIPFDPVSVTWDARQLLHLGAYYCVLAVPFFFFGLLMASAFSSYSAKSGLIYAADMVGAGIGTLAVLAVLHYTSPELSVFIISSTVLLAVILVASMRIKIMAGCMILLISVILYLFPELAALRLSPYKGLETALKYPGALHIKTFNSPHARVDIFKSPAVRFAPGLSLAYMEKLPDQTGIAIDGASLNAITRADDKRSLQFIHYLPSSLPYNIGKKDDVLVLDPKGGLQILAAQLSGAGNILALESNPIIVSILTGQLRKYSGPAGEYIRRGSGRLWLTRTDRTFDIIDIPLTGTSATGAFGIAENYQLTVEAVQQYISHLKPGGLISVTLYIVPPPRSELRILNTFVTALEQSGIKEPGRHIVAMRSWGSVTILLKRLPFTEIEIHNIKQFGRDRMFDMVFYHGISEDESNIYVRMPTNEYFKAFNAIIRPSTRGAFTRDYLFDVAPVYDDKPFFHYFLKLPNFFAIYNVMGGKWQYFIEEGYIIPVIFVQALIASLLLMFVPVAIKKERPGILCFLFFAMLGIAYMFVEIPIMQKMVLPLENPVYAAACVIAALLTGSGAGSLLSHNYQSLRKPQNNIITGALIILYSLLLSKYSLHIGQYPMPEKTLLIFVSLLPLGFFMGIPFAAGLAIIGKQNVNIVPWAWAVNGCFSVFAPLLVIMLAMSTGFSVVMWIGAGIYCLIALLLKIL